MIKHTATYFDGASAASHEATLQLFGNMVLLESAGGSHQLDRGNAQLIPPVGSGSWAIELEQGGRVEFRNDELGHAIGDAFGQPRFVSMLERSWPWALAMAVVAAVGIWATLTWGDWGGLLFLGVFQLSLPFIIISVAIRQVKAICSEDFSLVDRLRTQRPRLSIFFRNVLVSSEESWACSLNNPKRSSASRAVLAC